MLKCNQFKINAEDGIPTRSSNLFPFIGVNPNNYNVPAESYC